MINCLLLMLPKLQSNAQKEQNNLILVKKKTHDQNTSNYRTRNQNYCNKFSLGKKNMIMLGQLIKNPNFKNTKLIVDSGYQGIQKITIMF
ncbi:hypothetical protein [Spiroplasma poulsonii]|uniref:hypothetical protein n=1 Tax=Spiroplasma poulsonii TaxID=2138 RepID=UPI001F4C5822|nr:hypothetical protein [Spiroplasma poulsonii]UNF61812.1 hypothetical protein MNU24_07830 [Spiroplasma poulsonii]